MKYVNLGFTASSGNYWPRFAFNVIDDLDAFKHRPEKDLFSYYILEEIKDEIYKPR